MMIFKKWFIWIIYVGLLISSLAQAATEKEQALLSKANRYEALVVWLYQQGEFKQALPLAEKAFKIRNEILGEKHPDTLSSLNDLVIIYTKLGRFSEALFLSEKVYRLTKEILGEKHPYTLHSLTNKANIYNYLAIWLYQRGEFKQALPLAEKAFKIRNEILGEKHADTLRSVNNLALIYNNLGRLSEALPLSEKAYRLFKEVLGEKHPDTLRSLNILTYIYNKLDYPSEEALALSEKAYRLFKEVLGEKHPDTLNSLNNLAGIYNNLGRLSETLPLSEKAYRLFKEVLGEKHPNTLRSLNNLAHIYINLGRLSEALLLHEKAYRLFKEVLGEKHPNTLSSLNNLAVIYNDLDRIEEAFPLFEKAYRLFKEVLGEKHPDTLHSLKNFASIYRGLGYPEEALALSEKAYRLFKEVLGEKHPDTLLSLQNLANIYNNLSRLEEASSLYEKAYRLFKEVLGEKHPDTLRIMRNLAYNYNELDRLSEALPLYEKAYRLFKEVLGEKHPDTLRSLDNLAYAYLRQVNINKAIKHFEKLVQGVEHLRSGDLSVENRQTLFKQWIHAYFTLSELYIVQSRSYDAFRLAEMSKARTLLESLATKLAAQQSGLSATEQQQLQDYETRLAFLNNRIAKALEKNRLEEKISLETEKNQRISQFNPFHEELMEKYPKYAQLNKVQIIGAKEGAKYLPEDAVLISYLVNENQVLAFTLLPEGQLTAHSLGEISHLSEKLNCYRYQVSRGRGRIVPLKQETCTNMESVSRELGKILLEPLFEQIKDQTHWIISPNGPLALIPFEALFWKGKSQPIVAQYQINYVQSLSVLKLLRERETAYTHLETREVLLAMGAPLYKGTGIAKNKGNPSIVDFKIARQMVRRGGDYTGAFERLGSVWQDLPGALTELEQLEKLFKETRPRIYKQADATEAKLQTLNQQGILAQYRYLVFSTHGHLNLQIPELSSIVLGQVNNPPKIDGYVTAGEWPGYDLKSDLMVLSACETGLGKTVGGEGVMGLPYAFYVAGNKNTILTLWSISDEVTVEFITNFFAKLKAGVGQIEALTATKREFLEKGGRYANPRYWAAFVLYGV